MAETHAILGENLRLRGRIRGEGSLEIQGQFEGELELKGELLISSSALIRANLQATRILIGGAVVGDIVASQSIMLDATARVVGNVKAPNVIVVLGAQYKGEIDMGLEPRATSQSTTNAVVKTSVRSSVHMAPTTPAQTLPNPVRPHREVDLTTSWPGRNQEAAAKVTKPTSVSVPASRTQSSFFSSTNSTSSQVEESASSTAHEPPLPVVPAIKKGTKASTVKKKNV